MNPQYASADYREEVEALVGSFAYERCDMCGGDLEDHLIAPDPFGHPHLYCLDGATDEELARLVREAEAVSSEPGGLRAGGYQR